MPPGFVINLVAELAACSAKPGIMGDEDGYAGSNKCRHALLVGRARSRHEMNGSEAPVKSRRRPGKAMFAGPCSVSVAGQT
jgi:hypothetical protein